MFSGKTSFLMREYKRWKSIDMTGLIINYDRDKRYTDEDRMVTHDRDYIDCMMIGKISGIPDDIVLKYDMILINEGQFFNDIYGKVKYWCNDLKKTIIVSGLDGNYLKGGFDDMLRLIPECDVLIKLKALCALCRDGTEAIFTWKICDNPLNTDNIIDICSDKYIPLCRKHYNEEYNKTVLN